MHVCCSCGPIRVFCALAGGGADIVLVASGGRAPFLGVFSVFAMSECGAAACEGEAKTGSSGSDERDG